MATNPTLTTRIALRTDTTENWQRVDPVLLKGEFAITLDAGQAPKIKVGVDGVLKWSEIDYTLDVAALLTTMEGLAEDAVTAGLASVGGEVYQVSALSDITATPKKGDIAIVSDTIAGDKKQLTAYVYDSSNSKWVAMDGNYNADNVFFSEDIVFTKDVGTITIPASGSTTYEATGKSLKEVLAGIFAKEDNENLKSTDPSLSINESTKYVEIGSTVTPTFSTTFDDGAYKYGPDPTGVTVVEDSYEVSNNKTAQTVLSSSGSFNDYTFTDVSSYTVTAKCDTTTGSAPKSNIGVEYSAQAFSAIEGLTSAAKTLYSSYKPNFYGYTTSANKLATIDATTLTSTFIRGLQNNQKQTTTPVSSYKINEGWFQFFYAMPLGRKTTLTAKDANNITFTVNKVANVTIQHEGDAQSTDYVVFCINNAAQYGATTINMTWA